MKKKRPAFLNNLGIKAIALGFAIILWLLVTNINDPVTERRFANVSVSLLNTNLISARGEVYSVVDNSDTVPIVTVRARRSVVDRLDKDNIHATADIEDISAVDTIEIRYSVDSYTGSVESIYGSINTVKLSIENRRTATFTLQVQTSGDVAAGYEAGTITPEQNQVRVSGPESVVSQISSAVATVDVSNATSSITTYSDIRLYDADGNEVSTSNLTLNISQVKVSVTVLPLKDFAISVETTGTPADGYMLSGQITTDPSTVSLAGRTSALSSVNAIVIPGSVVNVEGLSSDLELDVDITPYLPEGTSFEDQSFDGMVHVTVGIAPVETETVEADLSDITLTNVPEGYSAKLLSVSDGTETITAGSTGSQTVRFQISGLAEQVEALTAADIAPQIDVTSAMQSTTSDDSAGTYQAPVQITLSNRLTQVNTVTGVVSVTRSETAITSSAASTAGSSGSTAASSELDENAESAASADSTESSSQ